MAQSTEAGRRDVPVLPGGRRLPGHALEFGRDPLALLQRARPHGDVVRVRFGPFRVYLLNSPEAIRQALTGEARKLEKGLNFGRVKRLIGTGLVMSEGEAHRRQRRLMQPAFHRAQIARYTATMRDVAVPRIGAWPAGGTLALDRELRSITLTVLTRTLLSSDIGGPAVDEIERLQQEADLVLGGGEADYETLARLPYTRAVITETLRLYSPVWILPRRALADVELGGHLLPAGSRIIFSPYALNRDPRLHRDPDRFDPGRWADGYTRSDLRATFFPFGQGIRNCIGEGFAWTESLLLLSAIAARWQLRLADGARVHPVVSSTLVPSELPVIVTPRRPGGS
jgi:cytochrome P450